MTKIKRIIVGIVNVIRIELRRNKERVVEDFNGYKELVEYVDNNDGTLTVVKIYDVDTIDGVTFVVTGSNSLITQLED
jgi:ribosomal protein S4E